MVVGLAVLAGAGCGKKVGDSCQSSSDCDPTGASLTCDLSQPGGYCVSEGCDTKSCPSDSVCVRFFPAAFLTTPTSPCTDFSGCAADEVCLVDSGQCVRAALERRQCVQSCGGDGDCRGGYECRPTGMNGAVALTANSNNKPKFCAPKAQ